MKIAAVDGEIISPHGYCLLASSLGATLVKSARLSTFECFNFLLSASKDADRLFGYGIGLDVCHWIADLEDGEKARLAKTGRCYTYQGCRWFRVVYRPQCYFSVQLMGGPHWTTEGKQTLGTATVVDLMKWHRRPFVDACEEWGLPAVDATWMREMKAMRSGFSQGNSGAVEDYCRDECDALADLGAKMIDGLRWLEVPVSHPLTAGAVAGALAAKHKTHRCREELRPEVFSACLSAFFGGREQCARYGHFRDAVQWDVRSAYGWAMTQLPDMQGEWIRASRSMDAFWPEWSLLKVSWSIDEGRHPVMPFPWRDKDGRVHYPPRGTGWHWSPLVRSTLRNYPGADIRVLDAWHYIPHCDDKPFAYIGELAKKRQAAGDDPVAGLAKNVIVATWGRMCSQGLKRSATRGAIEWAGMTTALIQERILDAIHSTGEDEFISCCVDGFWTTSHTPNMGTGANIGSFKRATADDLLLLRPICYWKREGGVWSGHTAGIPDGASHADAAMGQWREKGRLGQLSATVRTCKGLLACFNDGDYDQMGTFHNAERAIPFHPGVGHSCPTQRSGTRDWNRWLPYWPPVAVRNAESAPFAPRAGTLETRWGEAKAAEAAEETME